MKRLLSILLTVLMVLTLVPTSVFAEEDIVEEFMDLQDKVTAVLEVDGDHYVYSEDEVISVIKAENFDFAALNEVLGTNYTEDSFIEMALYNIENTELGIRYADGSCPVQTRGTYCGRSAYEEGWNYTRTYLTESETDDAIVEIRGLSNEQSDYSSIFFILGDIYPGALGKLFSYIASLGLGISATWNKLYCEALEYNNDLSSCGTVSDINKFTYIFDVWNQGNFYE